FGRGAGTLRPRRPSGVCPCTTLFRSGPDVVQLGRDVDELAGFALAQPEPAVVEGHREVAGLGERLGGSGQGGRVLRPAESGTHQDRKSTRLNSSHVSISYAVFCLTQNNIVWTKYFKSQSNPLLRGRFFTSDDPAGSPRVVIINQRPALRHFLSADPTCYRLSITTI